jgi:uncharacterized protein (DUF305 family)
MMNAGNALIRLVPLMIAGALMAAAGVGVAQQPTQNPPMAGGHAGATGGDPMTQAMDRMNKAMAAAPMTGNADRDFVAMMIPHHQGAIDMATAELGSGKDPQLRRLARNIIAAQQREIRDMRDWQTKHPEHPAKP